MLLTKISNLSPSCIKSFDIYLTLKLETEIGKGLARKRRYVYEKVISSVVKYFVLILYSKRLQP